MKFRPALTSDAASIAAISAEVWLGTYIRNGVNAFFAEYALDQFTTARIQSILDDPNEIVIVSENLDGIDGFIRVTLGNPAPDNGCSDTEISTLYVQPRHHGKGLGKGLLRQAMQQIATIGISSVWLATNSQNAPAIGFYQALGFQRIGHTHFRIQDQAYLNVVLSYQLDRASGLLTTAAP